jgi:hypothetical protein
MVIKLRQVFQSSNQTSYNQSAWRLGSFLPSFETLSNCSIRCQRSTKILQAGVVNNFVDKIRDPYFSLIITEHIPQPINHW